MAKFSINIAKPDSDGYIKYTNIGIVSGAKMTKSWIKNAYGEKSCEYTENHEFYRISSNSLGIAWVTYNPKTCVYETSGLKVNVPFNSYIKTIKR